MVYSRFVVWDKRFSPLSLAYTAKRYRNRFFNLNLFSTIVNDQSTPPLPRIEVFHFWIKCINFAINGICIAWSIWKSKMRSVSSKLKNLWTSISKQIPAFWDLPKIILVNFMNSDIDYFSKNIWIWSKCNLPMRFQMRPISYIPTWILSLIQHFWHRWIFDWQRLFFERYLNLLQM